MFEQISDSEEMSNVKFYKVDTDGQQQIAEEVNIRALPTFAIFHKEQKVDEFVGANPAGLKQIIDKALTLV